MHTKSRRLLAALAVIAAGLGSALVFQVTAAASGTVVLSPMSGPVGTTVEFSGSDCVTEYGAEFTGDNIRAYFREISPASGVIGTGTVDAGSAGRPFSGSLEIPDRYFTPVGQEFPVTPGTYEIVFDCSTFANPNNDMSTTFTVTGTGSTTTAPTTTAPESPTTSAGGGAFEPPAEPPADAASFSSPPTGSVSPGGTVVIDEPGFRPGEEVPVVLYSDPVVLGTPAATAAGDVEGSFTIPLSTPAGQHTLVLYGADTVKAVAVTVAAPATPASATPVQDIALTG